MTKTTLTGGQHGSRNVTCVRLLKGRGFRSLVANLLQLRPESNGGLVCVRLSWAKGHWDTGTGSSPSTSVVPLSLLLLFIML
jgi:hypothetical protein